MIVHGEDNQQYFITKKKVKGTDSKDRVKCEMKRGSTAIQVPTN